VPDPARPAFYAAGPGRWRDWWTLLHPPYTVWHLSYVVLGAALAGRPSVRNLVVSVVAFFFALGLAAHALDELNGRPLRTGISDRALVATAGIGLLVAVGLGAAGAQQVSVALIPFIVVGGFLVVAYNLELFGGSFHSDVWFALGWGAFPVITGCVAQDGGLTLAAGLAAVAGFALSAAQRALSTPARLVRRRGSSIAGTLVTIDGEPQPIDRAFLLAPLEQALRALSVAVPAIAAGVAVARLT
jgi:hypothetical protein